MWISLTTAADFETEEFNDLKSPVATVYMCAVVGVVEGYADDTFDVIAKATPKMGISAQQSDALMMDAFKWYEIKQKTMDFKSMWDAMCKVPFNNLRTYSAS